jgi:hypothetical protein
MNLSTEPGVASLLSSAEPGIRYLTRVELLEEPESSRALVALSSAIEHGPKVSALLDFEDLHPYQKWRGSHWRLVSLVELGLPAGHPKAQDACQLLLHHWATEGLRAPVRIVDGLPRRHASQEGNALAVACRLGLAEDPRARVLAEELCGWQWPDGGWNCDDRSTHRSSFHETLAPCWGLIEHHRATGEPRSLEAALRAAQLFVEHRLYFSSRTGQPIHPSFVAFHWPPYWHYDVLQALRVLAPVGVLSDPRCEQAFELLSHKRLRDGGWRTGGRWWRAPRAEAMGKQPGNVEAVDWGITASEMVTLNALRAIKGRRHP